MQRLTTREPDDEMIEVGISALKCALPDEFPGYYEECLEMHQSNRLCSWLRNRRFFLRRFRQRRVLWRILRAF